MKRAALLLFLLAGTVYINCLPNEFTQDDFLYIVFNEDIQQAPWRLFARPDRDTYVYRPLGMLSYSANYAVGDLKPLGFHLVNLLLHAAVTVLLYWLVQELLDRPRAALVAALLFAVHPIHTETVASAVGRTELLATGFLLGAWRLHLGNRFWAAASCFLLALMSKESAVAFLALAPLGDYVATSAGRWPTAGQGLGAGLACGRLRDHSGGRSLPRFPLPAPYALYAGVFGFYLVLRWQAVGMLGVRLISFLDNPLAELPPLWRVLNALRVAWKYLALQLFPATLSSDYSFNAIPVTCSWMHLLPAVLAGAAVLALWLWSARRHAAVFLAGGLYLAGFAITANILFPIGTILGERLTYLPSAGLCLLAGLGWEWLAARRRTAAVVLLAMVAAALAARTVVRNRDWRDNFTLFAAAVEASPESAKARHNLGVAYMDRGELEKARAQLDIAYRIYPQHPDLLGALGLLYFRTGDKSRAEQFMKAALERTGTDNPNFDHLATNYASLLTETGRHDVALAMLDRIIAKAPRFARAYANRAVVRYHRREWDRARADAETALRLDPRNSQARSLLARLNRLGSRE